MTHTFMPQGTLARMSRDKNLVNDLLTLDHKPNGYTEDELTSVRVVTLHEYAQELATKEVMLDSKPSRYGIGLCGTDDAVNTILHNKYQLMKEFVAVMEDGEIVIGINKTTVNDETVAYALRLLFKVEDINPGAFEQIGDWIPLNWC